MESSILKSTKETLGIAADYTAFDNMIVTHINTAFSVLTQIGLGPSAGFSIEGGDEKWDEFILPIPQMSMIKTYVYLKVRSLFDPPATSYLITALEKQIEEHEVRLSMLREEGLPTPDPAPPYDGAIEYIPIDTYMEGGY